VLVELESTANEVGVVLADGVVGRVDHLVWLVAIVENFFHFEEMRLLLLFLSSLSFLLILFDPLPLNI